MAKPSDASVMIPALAGGAVAADRAFTLCAWLFGVVAVMLPLALLAYLIVEGLAVISWDFLTEPPRGTPLGKEGGIAPAIAGSLWLILIGLLVALPLGIATAIALSEYAAGASPVTRLMRFCIETLAAVPAILFGLFGYAFFVVYLQMGISLLAGGLTLGVMMLPVIVIGAYAAMQSISMDLREGALALGVTRIQVIRRIVLPKAWPGIIAVTVIAAAHALGSAAPIMFTASVAFAPGSRFDPGAPVMTLPTHLYYIVSEGINMQQAYGTSLVLVAGLLLCSICAMLLRNYLKK
jgi:phosphate transport system permease protein